MSRADNPYGNPDLACAWLRGYDDYPHDSSAYYEGKRWSESKIAAYREGAAAVRAERMPEVRSNTIGVTEGNPDVGMPPFAVDTFGGQGNGDMSDAVIGIRGYGVHCMPGASEHESTIYAVGLSKDESLVIRMALLHMPLAVLAGSEGLPFYGESVADRAEEVRRIADRFAMVPGR